MLLFMLHNVSLCGGLVTAVDKVRCSQPVRSSKWLEATLLWNQRVNRCAARFPTNEQTVAREALEHRADLFSYPSAGDVIFRNDDL